MVLKKVKIDMINTPKLSISDVFTPQITERILLQKK